MDIKIEKLDSGWFVCRFTSDSDFFKGDAIYGSIAEAYLAASSYDDGKEAKNFTLPSGQKIKDVREKADKYLEQSPPSKSKKSE